MVPGRRVRILCIDDEPLITRMMARVMHGHEVFEYSDGCAAIAYLVGPERPHYDVIVCDVIMPGCSGMDVYRAVERDRPDLLPRIVFSSGATIVPGIDSFLLSVPNAKVDKPFHIDRLRAVLLEVGSRKY